MLAEGGEGQGARSDQRDNFLAQFSGQLFLRCTEMEPRTPVIVLQNERSNL